jgi:tetratricopeptide (TPR) repeat protein
MKTLAVVLFASALHAQIAIPDVQPGASSDERIHSYQLRLEKTPSDPKLIGGLVSAYLQKLRETGDYSYFDRASKLVDKLAELDGGDLTTLRWQNEIDLQRHDFKAVADRSRDMIRFNRSDPGIWGNLGDALMELGEYDGARDAYTTMFTLRPNLGSYNRLAWYRFVTGDAPAAIDLMKMAIDAGGSPETTSWCWAELGDMYFKTGKLGDAEAAFTRALALFPQLHRASAGLGKTQAARGDLAAAIRSYQKAQSIVPLVEYTGALEDLYTRSASPAKAREQRDLLTVIEKLGKASNEKTNRTLALVLADHGRNLPLALELVRAEIVERPDVYTWDALSWVLFKNGRIPEAREASKKALKFQTPEPQFYYHALAIAEAAGDSAEAESAAARLQTLNPKFDVGK